MNDEQFKLACEKELRYIAKQERKLQKQAMASDKSWKSALESVIPEKVYVNLRAAFATAFNIIFEKGVDVIEKTYSKDRILKDFEEQDTAVDSIQTRRELRKFRSNVSSSKRWKSIITTAEGVGLGALGIGLPDIVLFIGFILQSVYEVALKYGYDYNKPEERYLILKMLSASIAKREKWLDADVSFEIYDYGSIVEAARSGKVDLIAANLQITPERAEALQFSTPLYREKNGILVRSAGVSQPAETTVHWQDYNGKKLGVLVGPLMEDAARENFPDSEYLLFNSYPDCITALLTGKIDGFLGDEPGIKSVHAEQPEVDYIRESLTENNYSFAFRKDDPESAALCEEFNAFLAKCWADGTMRELDEIWLGVEEARKVVDMSGLTGENGTIRVVTTAMDMPWSYIKDGLNVGYDIDLIVRFCRERGYALELGDVDFAGRIPALQSGKYDFTTDMNVTPEREEQVLFSDPTAHGGIVLAVRASDLAAASKQDAPIESGNTQGGMKASFEKTFLREGRWKLFLRGVETTLLITVLSILFGTALGFFVFMLCRNGNPAANAVTRFCVWLVQGMPMVVLLMVLYYIIFGNVSISGVAVAVVGFTLTFGAAVFALMKMGVGMIDRGQYEAAYALGHSNRRTFYRVILPQAIPHVLPAYRGEIVSLLKATAVVGYIAVQDLTKMGDIVRSRTYEAFFPLIAVTLIYFALEGLLNALIRTLQVRIDPKRRSRERILKGVKTDD